MDKMDNPMDNQMVRAGICGLYCDSCALYIGTTEEPERLTRLAQKYGKIESDMTCEGCRSETLSFYCKDCNIKSCAREKDVEFCAQCADYPCDILTEFKAKMPHRNDLFKSLDLIKEKGAENWLEAMKEDHSCSACGITNSPYDAACRKCGHTPSSGYHERHRGSIMGVGK